MTNGRIPRWSSQLTKNQKSPSIFSRFSLIPQFKGFGVYRLRDLTCLSKVGKLERPQAFSVKFCDIFWRDRLCDFSNRTLEAWASENISSSFSVGCDHEFCRARPWLDGVNRPRECRRTRWGMGIYYVNNRWRDPREAREKSEHTDSESHYFLLRRVRTRCSQVHSPL